MKSKKFFNKSYQANWLKGGYRIKSQNYAVIWSQIFISSQSELSMESKKFCYKSFKAHQHKKGYEIKCQYYAVMESKKFLTNVLKHTSQTKGMQ